MTGLFRCETRLYARFPNQGLRLDAGAIGQPQLGDPFAKLGIVTEAGIEQCVAARKSGLAGPADVSECNHDSGPIRLILFSFVRLMRHKAGDASGFNRQDLQPLTGSPDNADLLEFNSTSGS